MKSERENASLFRLAHTQTSARDEDRVQRLSSALDRLKRLLEVRESLSREIRLVCDANEDDACVMDRIEAESDMCANRAKQANSRYRDAAVVRAVAQREENRAGVQKIVNMERAKQLLESVKRDLSKRSDAFLVTLEDKLREKKLERLRGQKSLSTSSIEKDQKQTKPEPPIKHTLQSTVASKASSRSLRSSSSQSKSVSLSDVRKSIDSIRRRSWDAELDQLREELASEVTDRELLDPSRAIERKRATLAALKLKSRKS
jgi:hypothetical protein